MTNRYLTWNQEAKTISSILEKAPTIDKSKRIGPQEFKIRQDNVIAALDKNGIDVALVYSDEHYCGDVPYLGGNTNITN